MQVVGCRPLVRRRSNSVKVVTSGGKQVFSAVPGPIRARQGTATRVERVGGGRRAVESDSINRQTTSVAPQQNRAGVGCLQNEKSAAPIQRRCVTTTI